MASYTTITLDTTAPTITWGAVANATAGATLTALYTIDADGTITSATLTDAGNTALPMTVLSDRLTVALPPDTPNGLATISAEVVDDVGNAATRTVSVLISGVVVVPEPTPAAPSGLPRRSQPRVHEDTTRVRVSSRFRTRTRHRYRSNVRVLSHPYDTHCHTPENLRLQFTETVRTRSVWGTLGMGSYRASLRTAEETSIRKRPEGPRTEEDLLSLDLL